MVAQHPPRTETYERADISRAALWFGLVGGVAAWLTHFLLAYAISEFGCVAGWDQVQWAGLSALTWALVAITVLTVALAAGSVLAAFRSRYRLKDQRLDVPGEAGVLAGGLWMAYTGLISGAISLLVILVQSIPILYWLGGC